MGAASTEPTAASTPRPSALQGRVGQVLELNIPLLGGGHRDLAQLHGRSVLIELADSSVAEREQGHRRYRALLAEYGAALTVVTVALDSEAAALPESWTDDPPPFVLGWDPQGAVAARLQLSRLPTVVLLDATGAVVQVHEGTRPENDVLRSWLQSGSATDKVAADGAANLAAR